jgi:hypothetical protein
VIHPAGRDVRGIEQVRLETGPTKQTRQLHPIVQRRADPRMSTTGVIRPCLRNEQLTAARRESSLSRPPHHEHGQIPQQHEMNQRQQQPFGECAQFLTRHPAGKGDFALCQEADHSRQRIRREPHVRVHENQPGMIRSLRQHMTRVLFAAPTSR